MLLNKITDKILNFYVLFMFFILPTFKYFEYVHGGVRLNGAMVSLSLFFIVLTAKFFLFRNVETNQNKLTIVLTVLLFVISFYQLVLYPYVVTFSKEGTVVFLKTITKTIVRPTLFLFIGLRLQHLYNTTVFKTSIKLSWVLSTFILVFYTLTNPKGFFLFLDNAKIYLQIADAYAVLSFFFLSSINKKLLRFVLFVFSSVVVFSLLSRTSFYLFIFTYLAYMFLVERKQLFTLLFIFLLGVTYYVISVGVDMNELANNRMVGFILTGQDASVSARDTMVVDGMNKLKENWLFGDYLGEVRDNFGNTGAYMHNVLSIWRQFGFFPFITMVVLLVIAVVKLIILLLKNKKDNYIRLLFFGFTFAVTELLTARGYTFTGYWLFICAVLSFKYKKDKEYEQ